MKRRRRIAEGCLVLFIMATPSHAGRITADDIVAASAEALGGQAAIDNVKSMRIVYRLPDHGGAARLEIARPNRLRIGDFCVFDGARAAMLAPSPDADGTLRPAELIPAEEWKDFEMQVGWFFPAFLDHPAVYGGIETIDCIEVHRLDVQLSLGARLTYYIDTGTYLPFMIESRVTVDGRQARYTRILGDYRAVGGVLFPHEFSYYAHRTRKLCLVPVDVLEVNPPLADDRFALPPGL